MNSWKSIGSAAALVALCVGCAGHRGGVARASLGGTFAQPRVSRFGVIVLAQDADAAPASFMFQRAKGKLGTVRQAIWDSAEMGLSAPGAGVIMTGDVLGGRYGEGCGDEGSAKVFLALAGAAGGVAFVGAALAGPVVGAEGLIRSFKKISPEELVRREAALTNALSHAAAQDKFRAVLLDLGKEELAGFGTNHLASDSASADALLLVRVDELQLARAGSGEDSYFLRIKTHARVVRTTDGEVCYQEDAEYHSGKALFLDWTLAGAIESVAHTGYEALARHYLDQLVPAGEAGGQEQGSQGDIGR